MMEYERLTERRKYSTGIYVEKLNGEKKWQDAFDLVENERSGLIDEVFDRLAELEDKIEQGTLIELPCKVGDTVYETEGVRIYEHKIDRLVFIDKMLIYDTADIMFDERAIGHSVFLTREEAEKRLVELQGETKL